MKENQIGELHIIINELQKRNALLEMEFSNRVSLF